MSYISISPNLSLVGDGAIPATTRFWRYGTNELVRFASSLPIALHCIILLEYNWEKGRSVGNQYSQCWAIRINYHHTDTDIRQILNVNSLAETWLDINCLQHYFLRPRKRGKLSPQRGEYLFFPLSRMYV